METFSALLAICAGNSSVPGEFPTQRPVTRNFDVFLDLRLNKRLSKQWWGWWFETLSCPLWRHRNEPVICEQIMFCETQHFLGQDNSHIADYNSDNISRIRGLYWLKRRRLMDIGIPITTIKRSDDHLMVIMRICIPKGRCHLSE